MRSGGCGSVERCAPSPDLLLAPRRRRMRRPMSAYAEAKSLSVFARSPSDERERPRTGTGPAGAGRCCASCCKGISTNAGRERRPVRSPAPTVSSARSVGRTNAAWRRPSARCRSSAPATRARGSRQSAPARRGAEPAAGALLARGAPPGGRRGRLAFVRRSAVRAVRQYRRPGTQASGGTVGGSRGCRLRRLLRGASGRAGPVASRGVGSSCSPSTARVWCCIATTCARRRARPRRSAGGTGSICRCSRV